MGRSAPKASLPSISKKDEDLPSDFEEDSGVESQSDEGSEYGSKKKKTEKAPPAKRARRSLTTSAQAQGGASPMTPAKAKAAPRRRKYLSLFPTMPLDILFEILGQLQPRDLLSVSRTNKSFRTTLHASNAQTVWKNSREQCGAPECPRDLTEPRWANLLFGHRCQCCGAKNIPKADFFLRRRVCTRCKKANLVVRSKFPAAFPKCDESILALIPATNVGGWAHGHASSSKFYWKPDVEAMIHKLAEFEHQIDLRAAGAQAALDDFKQQRWALVDNINSTATNSRTWADEMASERERVGNELGNERQDTILAKFAELGYKERDIHEIKYHAEVTKKAALTPRIWERIRPILEAHIRSKMKARLVGLRENVVAEVYDAYIISISPHEWKYLPPVADIYKLEPFARHIDAEPEVDVTEATFAEAVQALPDLLRAQQDALKAALVDKLRAAPVEDGEVLVPDCLELARSVFKCSKPHGPADKETHFVGAGAILSHRCPQRQYHYFAPSPSADQTAVGWNFRVDPVGVKIADSVIRCAGLDPATASVAEMDAKDDLFTCRQCNDKRHAYAWRGAIEHSAEKHSKVKAPSWTALPAALAQELRAAGDKGEWGKLVWVCAHCAMGAHGAASRADVVAHLSDQHAIPDPAAPRDLFATSLPPRMYTMDMNARLKLNTAPKPPAPEAGASTQTKTLRCVHCPPKAKARLFCTGGIAAHLAAKYVTRLSRSAKAKRLHKVKAGQMGVDYAEAMAQP